jgi:hypothetical protein
MRQYKLLISSLAVAAAMAAGSASAAGLAKGSFVVPKDMADNWDTFAGVQVSGRIKKLEPWALYESLNPCTIDEKFCEIVRSKLLVATVQVAKSPEHEVTWVVTVPKEQYLKLGEVVQLILPKTTNELADMVLDKVGKIVTPKCTWGQVVNGGNFEGVICDGWNYSDLKFVAQKKKPVATP